MPDFATLRGRPKRGATGNMTQGPPLPVKACREAAEPSHGGVSGSGQQGLAVTGNRANAPTDSPGNLRQPKQVRMLARLRLTEKGLTPRRLCKAIARRNAFRGGATYCPVS